MVVNHLPILINVGGDLVKVECYSMAKVLLNLDLPPLKGDFLADLS